MPIAVSVVIPVRNNAEDLPAAVRSALAQHDVEQVLLCVGPSEDDSLGVARRLAHDDRVEVIVNDHGGIPQALNLGLAGATGERLLRLDAHSVLPDTYLADAAETAVATGAANVGAVQRPVGKTLVERGIAAAMASRFGSGGAAYREGTERKPVDTAFLGFFDTAVLRSLGGWDERFARNEDAELNIRLAAAGHEVWLDPRLVVDYRPRDSLRKLADQYFHYGWWRLRTIRQHPSSLSPRQLAAPVIVISVSGSLVVAVAATPAAAIVPVSYLAAVAASAGAGPGSVPERLVTAVALPTMHFSWAIGFLASAVRSLLPGDAF